MADRTRFNDKTRHRCEIIDHAIGKSSKGTTQIVIRFNVLQEYTGPETLIDHGRTLTATAYLYLTEKTQERTVRDLQQLGFDGYTFAQLDRNHSDAVHMVGTLADFYCQHNEYNGDINEKWSVALSAGGGAIEVESLNAAEMRQLDGLFGKGLLRPKGSRPAAPKPLSPPQPAVGVFQGGIDDDDSIPF